MNNPTEKQISAIINMRAALHWTCEIPNSKEECSKLIGDMKKEIETRLATTGQIAPIDYEEDDDSDNYDSLEFMNDNF